MKFTNVLLLLALINAGCGAPKKADIGDERRVVSSELASYVAVWDGYAEGYEFPGDATDRVRITINADGSGTLRVGEEALLPLASDPNGLFPPTYAFNGEAALVGLRSGFEFPLLETEVSEERLKLEVDHSALMESWCALQPSTESGWTCGAFPGYVQLVGDDDGTTCFVVQPGVSDGTQDGTSAEPFRTELDCDVARQCNYCSCDNEGCHAKPHPGNPGVDAALRDDGDKLDGTLTVNGTRINLRMQRQP
jgi:hypothetical protein